MFNTIVIYFLLFIIYSFLGWCMEMVVCNISSKKVVNRGFLIGPVCPIYGFGCLLIIILLKKYYGDPLVLFVMSVVLCSLLEYFTSYLMEKLFNARWWDYSDKKFNINGRICLNNLVLFGLLGLIMIYILNPFFMKILSGINTNVLFIVAGVIFILFFVDNLISLQIISGFKNVAKSVKKDSTAEITARVRELLLERGWLYKRLVSAFDFKASEKLIKDFSKKVKIKVKKEVKKVKSKIQLEKERRRELKKKIISDYNLKKEKIKLMLKEEKEKRKEMLRNLKK